MTREQREKLHRILLTMRHELLIQMKEIKSGENEASAREVNGDLSGYSFHLADQATDTMDHQRNFINIERESEVLHEIDDALDKVHDGQFGKCEDCGQEIGIFRLEALPYARLCVECKTRDEAERNQLAHRSDGEFHYRRQPFDQDEEDDE